MVDFLLTGEASVSHWALTEVSTFRVVYTVSTIHTRSVCTGAGAQLAVAAVKARRTCASVAIIIVL